MRYIFQEDLVRRFLAEKGQMFLPLEKMGLTPEVISDNLFEPAIQMFFRYRPFDKTIKMTMVDTAGVTMPGECQGILRFRPFQLFPYIEPNPGINPWQWTYDPKTRILAALPGMYNVTYLVKSEPLYEVLISDYFETGREGVVSLKLKSEPVKGTISVTTSGAPEAIDDGEGLMTVSAVAKGTVDYKEREIKIDKEVFGTLGLRLTVAYRSVTPAVELPDNEPLFIKLFFGKLAESVGTMKKTMKMEGLPFDVTADGMMEEGRRMQEEVEKKLQEMQKWWLA